MAGICLESSRVCESNPRSARRRRMEIWRFKFVGGAESMASSGELRRKKRDRDQDEIEKISENESSSSLETDQSPSSVESGGLEEPPRCGMTSVIGRRRDMEDAVSVRTDFLKGSEKHHFFGVFDCHGCSHVAASCRDRMHEFVASQVERSEPSGSPEWKEVMERGFSAMDEEVVAAGPTGAAGSSCRYELQTLK